MKNLKKKSVLMLAMMVLLLTFAVGGTIAYLVTSDGPLVNTFTPAELGTVVIEPGWDEGDDTVKENVTIQVTGNIEAKVRAAIVVTWQDENGNVSADVPVKETDYSITIGSNWTENNGIYYYNSNVQAPGSTTNLINSCTVLTKKDGYHLVVEVLASAIQADQNWK